MKDIDRMQLEHGFLYFYAPEIALYLEGDYRYVNGTFQGKYYLCLTNGLNETCVFLLSDEETATVNKSHKQDTMKQFRQNIQTLIQNKTRLRKLEESLEAPLLELFTDPDMNAGVGMTRTFLGYENEYETGMLGIRKDAPNHFTFVNTYHSKSDRFSPGGTTYERAHIPDAAFGPNGISIESLFLLYESQHIFGDSKLLQTLQEGDTAHRRLDLHTMEVL